MTDWIKPLQVIRIFDECIRPPGPKMVVSIEPDLGFFFRINSKPIHQVPVLLTLADHPFLDYDSYLECGEPLSLDDYIVEESIRDRGILGSVDSRLSADIFAAVSAAKTVSPVDKETVRKALGC